MPNPPGLIATLRAELARRELTQSDLAETLGISRAGITDRFKGRTSITVDELILIAERLDLPVADLLRDLTEPSAAAS